ncbi:MBL fold metallo-hydrolase [Rhizosphaericola mali]|uniref:MBL fold metallo-hydrolase n=1 Tax=Rhizosphaericola mali TaxID=2545455 RepID=A0A5P2G2C2_9BACT|nr:MBL fold metallo-hydrolase [Rhizosphaericola mali]QES89956.1 MBL fold metallo-hydrolase [Rhizosphaericola mali]
MYVEQIYTGCLSEASYYIEDNGEAVIIDPMRDLDNYLGLAKDRNATIKYIFETHFHADFVSGHLDLSKATGAPIVYGPDAKPNFKAIIAKDHQTFPIGNISLEVLHTPGHTLESTCYLLKDADGKEYAVFTGDTLFVGDVGRPDLSQKGELYTPEDLAGLMYDSLHAKIFPLQDDVIVYPAHGAGSSCGKSLSSKTFSTVGEQKETNYALLSKSRGEFISNVTDGLSTPPAYFPINAEINKKGYASLDSVLENALQALDVDSFEVKSKEENVIILDTRNESDFTDGFIPTSIFIGLNGRFAEWAGSLLPFDATLLLVTDEGKEKETATRLARVGFEKFGGYLKGGFDAWKNAGKQIDLVVNIPADEVAMDYQFDDNLIILDVRKESEYAEGHVVKADNIPLDKLIDPAGYLADMEELFNVYLHCAGGYRSVIAASLIKRQGFHNIHNILGGYAALKETKIPTEKSKSVLN